MLTIIEKLEQRSLSKNGADTYEIQYVVEHKNGDKEEITTQLFSDSQEYADDIGKKIQLRHQYELNIGETKLERWGLGYRDVLNNKMGFILPWKDPVYKRSLSNGVRLPILRTKVILNELRNLSTKKTNRVEIEQLTKKEIRERKQKNILRYFSALTMFIVSIYSVINGFDVKGWAKGPFILSFITTSTIGAVYFFQARYTSKRLDSIGKSNNE